jgi:pimeloyl-ACP methyl ester carboxylesterase
MRTLITACLLVAALLDFSHAFAEQPKGSAYLDGGKSTYAVILCHGRGQYPTWKVVDPLRKGIHEKLGYHTLSLQMPATKNTLEEYGEDFPRSNEAIEAGIAFLRNEKNVQHIYLMGHSMGTRMATHFLASHPDSPIEGFIGVGIRNGGGDPVDSNANLHRVTIPVLDIYGDGGDKIDQKHAKARSRMVSKRYRQVLIPGANHTYDGYDNDVVKAVVDWLSERQ